MKDQHNTPSKSLLGLLLFSIKLLFLTCCGLFFFLLFGNPFEKAFEKRELDLSNLGYYPPVENYEEERIEKGIHYPSGLIVAEGYEIVNATCTACHSGKLVTQNRATYQGWKDMLTWMQETQGLWDMGGNEEIILQYLAKNYAPEAKGRRINLESPDWYKLD